MNRRRPSPFFDVALWRRLFPAAPLPSRAELAAEERRMLERERRYRVTVRP